MFQKFTSNRHPFSLTFHPVFLLADFFGAFSLMGAQWAPTPWSAALSALGSALLAIGVSLPIALHFQLEASLKASKILDACSRAGITAIFKSRKDDDNALRAALDTAVSRSTNIDLLAVAFSSLFDPGGTCTRQMRERLDDHSVRLRVLILDPRCPAAVHRATLEEGNKTIGDINNTLEHGLPTTVQERLKNSGYEISSDDCDEALKQCNCEVRVYKEEPILFMMAFQESIYIEQYHLGRPENLRAGSCIGKYVPVVEYSSDARACDFYKKHFDELWDNGTDRTHDIVNSALTAMSKPPRGAGATGGEQTSV